MAISGIDLNSALPPALINDPRVSIRNTQVNTALATADPLINGQITTQQAAEPGQEQNPIEQNALFINRTLRELNRADTEPLDSLLFRQTPFLRAVEATRMLNALEQNALFINEALRNLSLVTEPRDVLLINEISPELEASDIARDLDVIQQTVLQINETLQDTGLATSEQPTPVELPVSVAEAEVITTAAGAEPQVPGVVAEEAAPAAPAAAAQPAPQPLPAAVLAEPAPIPAALPPTEAAPTVTASAVAQEVALPRTPVTLRPDLTPYVLAVYEIRNPEPIPGVTGPILNDVRPLMPVGMTRAVGGSGLRRAWIREIGRPKQIQGGITMRRTSQEEKSIRFTLNFVNEDMAANGLPLHLVFARRGEDFSLDVYDCSDDEACWRTYEVPLPRQDMTKILSSLQNETGIIVNTSS